MSTTTPATLSLAEAAELLGIGRSTAYQAVRAGKFPSPVLRVNSRIVIPTAPLLKVLGLDDLPGTTEAA